MKMFILLIMVFVVLTDTIRGSVVHAQKSFNDVQNMNGDYLISNPNLNTGNKFSTQYSSYDNVEYFDVYSPLISTRYILNINLFSYNN